MEQIIFKSRNFNLKVVAEDAEKALKNYLGDFVGGLETSERANADEYYLTAHASDDEAEGVTEISVDEYNGEEFVRGRTFRPLGLWAYAPTNNNGVKSSELVTREDNSEPWQIEINGTDPAQYASYTDPVFGSREDARHEAFNIWN